MLRQIELFFFSVMFLLIRYSLYQTIIYLFVCVRYIDLHFTSSDTRRYVLVPSGTDVSDDFKRKSIGNYRSYNPTKASGHVARNIRLIGHGRQRRPRPLIGSSSKCNESSHRSELNNNLQTSYPSTTFTAIIHMKVDQGFRRETKSHSVDREIPIKKM